MYEQYISSWMCNTSLAALEVVLLSALEPSTRFIGALEVSLGANGIYMQVRVALNCSAEAVNKVGFSVSSLHHHPLT